MLTIITAVVVLLLIVGAMSVGVIMGRKPIAGSCGGLSSLGMKSACEVCGGNDETCEKEQERLAAATANDDLAYDAIAEARKRH